MAEQVKAKRGNVIDAFVDGARNGLKIACNSMLPNTLFGFTLTIILNLTGLADVIGVVFAPVMRIFGLPGVAATAVMAIFLSMGGAAGVIAGLFTAGQLTEPQVAILLPALLLYFCAAPPGPPRRWERCCCLFGLMLNLFGMAWMLLQGR